MTTSTRNQPAYLAQPGMRIPSQTLDPYEQHRITSVARDLERGTVEVTTNQGGPFVLRPTELLRWPRRLDGSTRHHPGPVTPEQLAIGDTLPLAGEFTTDPGLWTVSAIQPSHPLGNAILVVTHQISGTRGISAPLGLPIRPLPACGQTSEYNFDADGEAHPRRIPASRSVSADWYQGFGPYLVPGPGENPRYDVELPPTDTREFAEIHHLVMMADRDGRGRWPLPFKLPGDEWTDAGLDHDLVYRRPPAKWDFDEDLVFVGDSHSRHPRDPRDGFGWKANETVNELADSLVAAYQAYSDQIYQWRRAGVSIPRVDELP